MAEYWTRYKWFFRAISDALKGLFPRLIPKNPSPNTGVFCGESARGLLLQYFLFLTAGLHGDTPAW
jgi:hypothetical protein